MMDARDPMDRLSSAYTVEVGSETKERHLAEMGAALRTAPTTPIPVGFGMRRRIAAAVAAILVVAPAGMALAAEDAVPGEFLYPVKEITERVRSFVDHDIQATHRVEEVERLVFLRAPEHTVARAVERADSATVQLPESGELRLRLEIARERLQQQDEENRLPGQDGSGEGPQEPGSDSGKADSGAGSGTTVPSGSGGSSEQDQKGPGATGTTLGSGESKQGSGDAAGTMAEQSGTPPTTVPKDSERSSQP